FRPTNSIGIVERRIGQTVGFVRNLLLLSLGGEESHSSAHVLDMTSQPQNLIGLVFIGRDFHLGNHPGTFGKLYGPQLKVNDYSHSERKQRQDSGKNSRWIYPISAWLMGCFYLGTAGWALWLAVVAPGRYDAPWLRYYFGAFGICICIPFLILLLQ